MREFTKDKLRSDVEEMAKKEGDGCTELIYADNIALHVWAHEDAVGLIELEVIIVHTSEYPTADEDEDAISKVPGIDEFFEEVESVLEEYGVEKPFNTLNHVDTWISNVPPEDFWKKDGSMPSHDIYYSSILEVDEKYL